jgi:hypothetical protein
MWRFRPRLADYDAFAMEFTAPRIPLIGHTIDAIAQLVRIERLIWPESAENPE